MPKNRIMKAGPKLQLERVLCDNAKRNDNDDRSRSSVYKDDIRMRSSEWV